MQHTAVIFPQETGSGKSSFLVPATEVRGRRIRHRIPQVSQRASLEKARALLCEFQTMRNFGPEPLHNQITINDSSAFAS
jgi:hypothetical protein